MKDHLTISPRPVQRVDTILSRSRGKRVLHLGCTNWPYTAEALRENSLLHASLAEVSSELFGIDSDEQGLQALQDLGFSNLYRGNLERLDECELDDAFDLIVAGEMIEHLNNPGLFLSGVQRFLNPGGHLIITTINGYCAFRTLIYALRGKKGAQEPVHPDHVAYYSYATLRLLVERHGYRLEAFHFYDIGREHRKYNRFLVNLANDISVRLFPQLSDGLIAICSLGSLSGHTRVGGG